VDFIRYLLFLDGTKITCLLWMLGTCSTYLTYLREGGRCVLGAWKHINPDIFVVPEAVSVGALFVSSVTALQVERTIHLQVKGAHAV
jgi:hypothetical protein